MIQPIFRSFLRHSCSRPPALMGLWGLVFLLLAGCGDKYAAHPVKSDLAKSTLQDVLTSWKEGKSPHWWRSQQPEVVVQDMDWMSGATLSEFEILGDGKAMDANLHCDVRLVLEVPEKGSVERTVTYLVGTSPTLTVFRQVMP